jgi:hypothetical protein
VASSLTSSLTLKSIAFVDCPEITDVSIKLIVSSCKVLGAIALDNCKRLTNISLHHIAGRDRFYHHIEELSLARLEKVTDDGMLECYLGCRLLTKLECCHQGNITGITLYGMKRANNPLTHAVLDGCFRITDDPIEHLCQSCRGLRVLSVRGCVDIGDTSLAALGYDDTSPFTFPPPPAPIVLPSTLPSPHLAYFLSPQNKNRQIW